MIHGSHTLLFPASIMPPTNLLVHPILPAWRASLGRADQTASGAELES